VTLAFALSFPVIGLDQFLRTTPAQFAAHPVTEAGRWVTDSMMAVPLFAIGVLAADWIARRVPPAGGRGDKGQFAGRALLITLACALVLAPAWFQVDRTVNPVTARPLVFPHAVYSGDLYWVSPIVIITLACVPLVSLAAWAGYRSTRLLAARGGTRRWRPGPAAAARATAITVLVAAMPVLAWLLHQAAARAYASRVYETSATTLTRPRPHQVEPAAPGTPAPASGQHLAAAPGAFIDQAAHALQDGLAGQAVGLPVAVAVLLWGTRAAGASQERAGPQRAGQLRVRHPHPQPLEAHPLEAHKEG
jgi:hypothetical protein